jgi:hypothetical protein
MSKSDVRSATVSIKWREINSSEAEQKFFVPKMIADNQWETLSAVISEAQQLIMSHCIGKGTYVNMYECM